MLNKFIAILLVILVLSIIIGTINSIIMRSIILDILCKTGLIISVFIFISMITIGIVKDLWK